MNNKMLSMSKENPEGECVGLEGDPLNTNLEIMINNILFGSFKFGRSVNALL